MATGCAKACKLWRKKKVYIIRTAEGVKVSRDAREHPGAVTLGTLPEIWFCAKVGKTTLWTFTHKIAPTVKAVAKATPLVSEGLLVAVLWQESRFDVDAVGRATYMKKPGGEKGAKAKGVAQFMWSTAKALGVENRFDLKQAIKGQAKLLSQLLKTFGRHDYAIAAYNAGPAAVRRYKGVPPFRETETYTLKIMKHLNAIEAS